MIEEESKFKVMIVNGPHAGDVVISDPGKRPEEGIKLTLSEDGWFTEHVYVLYEIRKTTLDGFVSRWVYICLGSSIEPEKVFNSLPPMQWSDSSPVKHEVV